MLLTNEKPESGKIGATRKLDDRYDIADDGLDILSHRDRGNRVHILTADPVLAADVYERIHADPRMKYCELIKPAKTEIRDVVEEIDGMARDTVASRVVIIDVRRITLTKLQWAFNKVVGYNRRDLNKLCYIILIGDGPWDLFHTEQGLDVFVILLAKHRRDFNPAVFFFDPLIHYEPGEIERAGVDEAFVIPNAVPKRLASHFRQNPEMDVEKVRLYLRAADKDEEVRKKRLRKFRSMYKKRIAEQFPDRKEQLKPWLSKKGIKLASEKLNLYPLFFEDWVYDLMQKAAER